MILIGANKDIQCLCNNYFKSYFDIQFRKQIYVKYLPDCIDKLHTLYFYFLINTTISKKVKYFWYVGIYKFFIFVWLLYTANQVHINSLIMFTLLLR